MLICRFMFWFAAVLQKVRKVSEITNISLTNEADTDWPGGAKRCSVLHPRSQRADIQSSERDSRETNLVSGPKSTLSLPRIPHCVMLISQLGISAVMYIFVVCHLFGAWCWLLGRGPLSGLNILPLRLET